MGNFSRDTFNLDKNYVGVRLQQGVPLVDADWNELDDVIRNEIYALGQTFPDGVQPGSQSLRISPTSTPTNDLIMTAGSVLVGGRPLRVPTTVLYSTQPWFNNPTRAAQDGVAVIPPLTPPNADRTDIVYLNVWEREVRSTEDTNLINSAIGVETCVRLKREFAFRVAEGTQTLPATPSGHSFVPLALLDRVAGQGNITVQQIEDIRPKLFSTRGTRSISFVPVFSPFGNVSNPWIFDPLTNTTTCIVLSAGGFLPLVLPEGAVLLSLRLKAFTTGEINFAIFRKHPDRESEVLLSQILKAQNNTPSTFTSSFPINTTDRINIVDNSQYFYLFSIGTLISAINNQPTRIFNITIRYQY